MDMIAQAIDAQTVTLTGEIAIVLLISRLMFRLLNKEAKTILAIVAIVLLLQFVFNISPRQLWLEISHLPEEIVHLFQQIV